MTKNVKILGTTYNGVDTLNAKDASTNANVKFVETSDANAGAEDIKRDKTAYVNGQKVVGTSDAIVPEGECNIEIHDVVGYTIEDVTNYETVNIQVKDDNDEYLEAGSYYQVLNDYLYKTQWPDIPSEGYYYFYSSAYPIEYPSSDGIYTATKDGEYNYHFEQVSDGYYQINNSSIAELSIEPVYYFYDGGGETGKVLLYHNSDTPRSDLVTDGKALKISYIEQNDHYEYKTITTYPQQNGTYTYTAATDTFAPGGGGGPSTPGLYSYKDDTLTEVTSYWLMNFGSGEYTDLGSNTTYYLYNSNGPAAMPLADSHMWYIPGSGNMPEQLSAGTWHQSNGNDPVKLTNGHYNIDGTTYNSVATYPQADGNYTYTKSTDSFTDAPPAPSGTITIFANGYQDEVDVTNYATADVQLVVGNEPLKYGGLVYNAGSGLTYASDRVVYIWGGSGEYNVLNMDEPGVYETSSWDAGSSASVNKLSDGHYSIRDDIANSIESYPQADGAYIYHSDDDSFEEADIPIVESDTYYYCNGANLEYANGLVIINPEDGKAEDLPATGLLSFGSGGWNDYRLIDEENCYISDEPLVSTTITFDSSGNASPLSNGNYRIADGEVTEITNGYYGIQDGTISPITSTYVHLLGSGEYDVLDGYYFFEAANNEGTPLEIIDGQTWYMDGEDSYKLTNTLQAFMDQGQATTFDDMAIGTEETVTFVNGKQFKITRIQ